MSGFVIDANVAIKWVIEETGTIEALTLLRAGGLVAPDLIVAECANILWKKTQRGELTAREAEHNARLLERAQMEIAPTRHLLAEATGLANRLHHPAYDCLYLVVARERGLKLATADERLLRRLAEDSAREWSGLALSLAAAAAAPN